MISLAALKKYVNKAAHTCPDKHIGLKKDHRNKKSRLIHILYYIALIIDVYYII